MSELTPIEPEAAIELYLKDKQAECAESTMRGHRSRLRYFKKWCEIEGIENLNELSGRDMHEYRVWRRNRDGRNGTPANTTMKTIMDTIRVFTGWCEDIDAVTPGLSDKVVSPSITGSDDERDVMLDADVAEAIRDHLETYRYATREHVAFLLMWRGLLRRGGVRGIDLVDVITDTNDPRIEIRHRPETGTPLKKHQGGERDIGITDATAAVIEDYIKATRHDTTDSHDRSPLLTTRSGRPHGQTLQSDAYAVTRPCTVTNECPHDKDPETCDAAVNRHQASKCSSTRSPHAIRRGAITHWLQADVPEHAVADRCATDPSVLSKHYDRRSKRQKQQQRRKYLDKI